MYDNQQKQLMQKVKRNRNITGTEEWRSQVTLVSSVSEETFLKKMCDILRDFDLKCYGVCGYRQGRVSKDELLLETDLRSTGDE